MVFTHFWDIWGHLGALKQSYLVKLQYHQKRLFKKKNSLTITQTTRCKFWLVSQFSNYNRYVTRLRRWSFFKNDGMVMFFFQGTIAIDGFSMVLPSLDHHHWMFFYRSTIEIDGFLMVFPNSGAMVSDGFDLDKDLKMRIIVTDPLLRQLCALFRIQITLLLVKFWGK